MAIEHTLKTFDLDEYEAKVYLSLLERGPMTGYEVALFVGMKHPRVYYMLNELRKRGLVLKTPYPNKQLYSAKDPRELVSSAQQKVKNMESALPKLLAFANVGSRPNIKYFESIDGFKSALKEREKYAAGKELVAFYKYKETISEEEIAITLEAFERMAKLGTSVRGITQENERTSKDVTMLHEKFRFDIRTISKELYTVSSAIETVGASTLILSRDNGQNILIENQEIADSVRSIFELVWSFCPLAQPRG